MSTLPCPPSLPRWRRKLAVVSATLLLACAPALAVIDLPLTPLQVGSTVPPNILYQLDDSGSMQFEIMPDDRIPGANSRDVYYVYPPPANLYRAANYVVSSSNPRSRVLGFDHSAVHNVLLRSSTHNTTFYDPAITYTPWRRADGTSFGDSPPSAALWNPTHTSAGTVNLLQQQTANARWYTCSNASDMQCSFIDESRSYHPVTFYVLARSGANTDHRNYDRYQYRNGQLHRRNLQTGTETEVTSLNWGAGTDTRTVAREIQNFANWFTYYRSRILAARAGSSQAFADLGSGYRVGFITINEARRTDPNSSVSTNAYLPIPVNDGFSGTNKSNFFTRMLEAPIPAQGTPLRTALDWAGRYYERTDSTGPWGPGSAADQVSCRRNYAILTTDGYWNDNPSLSHIGNSDNTNGPTHVSGLAGRSDSGYTASRPYLDSHSNTLADIAMHYWKNDLRTDMINNVPGGSTDAFWQHMVTFGLSIGVQGSLNPSEDLPALTAGTLNWPNPATADAHKIDDLWHATVNSRGSFVAARNPVEFRRGLVDALRTIQDRTASASNVSANSTQLNDGSRIFQASFAVRNNEWTGELSAYAISSSGINPTPVWQSAEQLTTRAHTSRSIFSHNGSSGIPFLWLNLSFAQQTALGSSAVVNYLRGDRSGEHNGTTGSFRPRTSLLGDIVNSSPAYSTDSRTLFVGANDGMLHAFNADTGAERFAYVPGMLAPRLRALSDRNYLHEYFVDGEIAVSTRAQTPNQNFLIGALGRGGKGLYGLDVTSPDSFSAANVSWELSGDAEPHLGFVLGKPVIARTNSGAWVALVGNGYNSTSASAVLYVIRLSDGQVLARMDTRAGSPIDTNGLATPAAFDADGNGTVDFVYAGDLHGNLWKFDLSATATSGWTVANGGLPLFRAEGPDRQRQPITAQPAVVANMLTASATYGSRYVLFGTGRYLTADDPATRRVQSIYGLIDDGTAISGRTALRERTIDSAGMVAGRPVRTFSPPSANDMNNRRGWFMDLRAPGGIAEGERVVSGSAVYNFARPTLIVASIIPEQNECSTTGRGYLNAIDPFNGGAMPVTIFDLDNNRSFNQADLLNGAVVGSVDLGVGMGTESVVTGDRLSQGGSRTDGGPRDIGVNLGGPSRVGRISWREIVR